MALSYKARRRWALIILLIGLPIYIVVAVNVVALFERPPNPALPISSLRKDNAAARQFQP